MWVSGTFLVPALLFSGLASCDTRMKGTGEDAPLPVSSPATVDRGILEGQILFNGPSVPASTRLQNTTDPAQCGSVQSLQNVLISTGGGIENAIVRLSDGPVGVEPVAASSPLILHNRDCQFQPHVAVLTVGSLLETVNSDPVTHTVHLYGLFNVNVALGPNQTRFVKRLERPGLYVVKCDLHGWMQAYLRVDEHPFHAVSGPDGSFRIHNIPEGSYTLEVWHEYFGSRNRKVTISRARTTKLTLRYEDPSAQGR